MEAADDISYLSADMEDAVDKGILTLEKIYELIILETKVVNENMAQTPPYTFRGGEKNYKAKREEDGPYQFNMFLTLTRAQLASL